VTSLDNELGLEMGHLSDRVWDKSWGHMMASALVLVMDGQLDDELDRESVGLRA